MGWDGCKEIKRGKHRVDVDVEKSVTEYTLTKNEENRKFA